MRGTCPDGRSFIFNYRHARFCQLGRSDAGLGAIRAVGMAVDGPTRAELFENGLLVGGEKKFECGIRRVAFAPQPLHLGPQILLCLPSPFLVFALLVASGTSFARKLSVALRTGQSQTTLDGSSAIVEVMVGADSPLSSFLGMWYRH